MRGLLFILLLPFRSLANYEFSFGGWSYHSGGEYNYNQDHNGYGLEYYTNHKTHALGLGVFVMSDSYNKSAYHFGAVYRFKFNERFSVKTNFSYINRSQRVEKTEILGSVETKKYSIGRYQDFVILPFISYSIYDKMSIDFTYLPEFTGADSSVAFIKMNIRL